MVKFSHKGNEELIMEYVINLKWDDSAQVWIATSKDIPGLVLESGSYDALIEKIKVAVPELIELNNQKPAYAYTYCSERRQRVYA